MKFCKKYLFIVFSLLTVVSCSQKKINGVSLVSPPKSVNEVPFVDLHQINANWVAIIPFAFSKDTAPNVYFDHDRQWWGEKTEGVVAMINFAKKQQLKVFLKPHVWHRKGWIGDFTLETEQDWEVWEKEYTDYILSYAKVAQEQQVELFCVGTELKQVVLKRPLFFKELIKKVKQIYKGKLTYAANWDNAEGVNFWQELDYIGVDAYYTLSNKKEPSVDELIKAWQPIKQNLHELSKRNNKPILLTEYGFESCDFNTKDTWGSNGIYAVNEQAQANAYKALYKTFYNHNWFAGGFLWKWHLTETTFRNKSKTFTPQGKRVIDVIKNQFR
ncbi:glycoside hydrolase family 113 [Wenyingzhuangia aestuarii]|uniref:glycoside hydrolase family 113 n=1 Tax=Wenyingzhuangia aestuarii TaxID=1647582 RepID=UPI00143C0523|nr:hypothetical protein [Wenyingzhuangia aestuarii]NJB82145.1 hypothetical protein [Wenyingzhuangia aestuarii]